MSLYGYSSRVAGTNEPTVTMKEFEESLCDKDKHDPYSCIDCKKQCEKGKAIVKQLEKETRKPMSKRQLAAADAKINAMSNYLEIMKQPDPIKYIMEKYGCKNERMAKNKIYQWQHNYGTNLVRVAEDLKEIQEELAAYKAKTNNETSNADKAVTETPEIHNEPDNTGTLNAKTSEEKKMSRRQEEKISQAHLELMRSELEKEYLKCEADIEMHKKGIVDCEKRIEEITSQIQALRQVLDIFNAKNKLYV